MTSATAAPAVRLKARLGRDDRIMRAGLLLLGLFLAVTVLLPLYSLLSKSFRDRDGAFVGFANYVAYFAEPGLSVAVWNSLYLSVLATAISVTLAFVFAYALTRSTMPGRALFRSIAMVPLLAPSLLPGIALIYLFGNQGMIKGALFGHSIYGPIGIVMGEVFFSFPHAVLIISTALTVADQRLYDAAQALRAGPARIFATVTLPACRYGLISACFAVFTLVFTDFGVPGVVGGSTNVLATEIYKQVIGKFNFHTGAVVGMLLLAPAVLSFAVDRVMQRRQLALLSGRTVPFRPQPRAARDAACFLFCTVIALLLLAVIGVAAFGSLVKFWPYNLSLSLKNYRFDDFDATGWGAYWNSLTLAGWTAAVGTVAIVLGAYLVDKTRGFERVRSAVQFVCMAPLAVPGMVLGLSYIFFFNNPQNPLNGLYGTMAILVLSTIAHFYTVPHLTALTALKQIDPEFEAVSASLKVPIHRTFRRVTLPLCLPAILNVAGYLFVNAMTTVSAVVFLYTADTKLAAITILIMNDGGKLPSAAAMGVVIMATSAMVWGLQALLARGILRRSQAWRT